VDTVGENILLKAKRSKKYDDLVKSRETPFLVIPAKAGIQSYQSFLDAGSGPA